MTRNSILVSDLDGKMNLATKINASLLVLQVFELGLEYRFNFTIEDYWEVLNYIMDIGYRLDLMFNKDKIDRELDFLKPYIKERSNQSVDEFIKNIQKLDQKSVEELLQYTINKANKIEMMMRK